MVIERDYIIRYPNCGKIFCTLKEVFENLVINPSLSVKTPYGMFKGEKGLFGDKIRVRKFKELYPSDNFILKDGDNLFMKLGKKNFFKVDKNSNVEALKEAPEFKEGYIITNYEADLFLKLFE